MSYDIDHMQKVSLLYEFSDVFLVHLEPWNISHIVHMNIETF